MRWMFTCVGNLYCIGSVCNIVFLFGCCFLFVCLVEDLLFHILVRCAPSSWANDRDFQHSHFLSSAATYRCHCGTAAAAASLASGCFCRWKFCLDFCDCELLCFLCRWTVAVCVVVNSETADSCSNMVTCRCFKRGRLVPLFFFFFLSCGSFLVSFAVTESKNFPVVMISDAFLETSSGHEVLSLSALWMHLAQICYLQNTQAV